MTTQPFQIVTKPAGSACNLGCSYCFYLEKESLYPINTRWRMQPAVLAEYIRSHIASTPGDRVEFVWQGGEPTLLGVAFFENVVALQSQYAHGKQVHNALQTHGGLLDDSWGAFLATNQFLVGISVDGPAELHDIHRRDKQGRSTFDATMRGLDVLKRHGVIFNTLTVVNRQNAADPLGIYRFLKGIGSQVMQFIPLVERAAPSGGFASPPQSSQPNQTHQSELLATPDSVLPEQFGHFLVSIFDEWVRHDVGRHFVQHFDTALSIWMGRGSPLCVFAPECGRVMALEHNGDVYSCDHYVYPEWKIGNLMDAPLDSLLDSPRQHAFGAVKADLPGQCQRCSVRFACQGECPKHRFAKSVDGDAGLNYLCAAYLQFFSHIDLPMRAMAKLLQEGRQAADIMQILSPSSTGSIV